ncbi:MAG: hypothetical protein Fur0025_48290 [Oscillatoriaceae cyanobacterium]
MFYNNFLGLIVLMLVPNHSNLQDVIREVIYLKQYSRHIDRTYTCQSDRNSRIAPISSLFAIAKNLYNKFL